MSSFPSPSAPRSFPVMFCIILSLSSTRRYIPEYGILHNHRCESLRSYIT
jgi:hypothetical protein